MGSGANAHRFGPLSGPISEPTTTEIVIAPSGRVVVHEGPKKAGTFELAAHQLKAVVQRLFREIGADPTASGPISVQGVLEAEGFRLVIAGQGPEMVTVRLCRPAGSRRTQKVDVPAINDALDRGVSLLLTGEGRISSLLVDLARQRKNERMILVNVPTWGVAAECDALSLPLGLPIQASVDLGADRIFVDELPLERWYELLISPCPFVATLRAKDAQIALERLQTALLLSRPGISAAAVDQAIANAIGSVVEVEGDAVLSVMEPSLQRRSVSSALESPARLPSRVASVVVEAEDEDELPVGRVSREQLSLIRPEQLVSKSFLVDVGGVSEDTGIREWTDETGEPMDRATDDLDARAATEPPPSRPSQDATVLPPGDNRPSTELDMPAVKSDADKATKAPKKRKRTQRARG